MRPYSYSYSYCAMEPGALTLIMKLSKLSPVKSRADLATDDTAHEKTIAGNDSIHEV